MNPEENPDSVAPPDLMVRYSNFALIGRGGMGRVIGAHDNRLNRPVAIKLLPANSENAIAVMRFHQEAKAVSKLNNPHVVQVLDFGYTEAGEPYLVMEHVKGESLEFMLGRRGALPPTEAIDLGIQLCSALEHAHSNDVIHRDLKPANIMIGENQSIRVLDFGLARILDMDETDWRLTRPGQAFGTVLYMSPEQVRGEETDERSDIYSLALVILKMVLGALPFEEKTTLEIIGGRLNQEPPTIPRTDGPHQLLLEVLNGVLVKALAVQPNDRYSSMTDFKAALAGIPAQVELLKPVPAAPPELPARPSRLILLGLALVVLPALIAVYLINVDKAEKQRIAESEKAAAIAAERAKHARTTGITREATAAETLKTKFQYMEPRYYKGLKTTTDDDIAVLKGEPIDHLRFEGNHFITDKGVAYAAKNLPQLTVFVVRDCHVTDACIPSINEMKYLSYLDVQNSRITGKGLLKLSPDLPLTHIDAKNIAGVTDEVALHLFKTYPDIQFISLGQTLITSKTIKALPSLKKLGALRLGGNEMTDDDVKIISKLQLYELDLSNCPVTDKSVDYLIQMKTLKSLDFDYCPRVSQKRKEELKSYIKTLHIAPDPKAEVDPEMLTIFGKSDISDDK
jgi:serine/threonine-protein kinase